MPCSLAIGAEGIRTRRACTQAIPARCCFGLGHSRPRYWALAEGKWARYHRRIFVVHLLFPEPSQTFKFLLCDNTTNVVLSSWDRFLHALRVRTGDPRDVSLANKKFPEVLKTASAEHMPATLDLTALCTRERVEAKRAGESRRRELGRLDSLLVLYQVCFELLRCWVQQA